MVKLCGLFSVGSRMLPTPLDRLAFGPKAAVRVNARRDAHPEEVAERANTEGESERDGEGGEGGADALCHGEVSFLIAVNVSMG
jgi:hypothetical protein